MDNRIDDIKQLIDQDKTTDAINLIKSRLSENPDDGELHFLLGKLRWKSGERHEAISQYIIADSLSPNGPAAKALEMSRDIENYFNPDLLNP